MKMNILHVEKPFTALNRPDQLRIHLTIEEFEVFLYVVKNQGKWERNHYGIQEIFRQDVSHIEEFIDSEDGMESILTHPHVRLHTLF